MPRGKPMKRAVSQAQQRLAGAEMRRRRKGMRPMMPGMTAAEVEHMAETPRHGLPARKRAKRR